MESFKQHEISQWIKARSSELGFFACGIAQAAVLEEDEIRLRQWLKNGYHADMGYMERNLDKRSDPRQLLPGAKSVIVVLKNYFPETQLPEEDNYKIAKYAYGKDYHLVIKEKLYQLIREIDENFGPVRSRTFTDSAPVLERSWAAKAGLGWVGKNTCLIHPKYGSFVFIAEIITDLELEYDNRKVNDLCGGCTRCIDACPTGAIIGLQLLDARRCISYHTIESRGELPAEMQEQFGNWIFGCDICQEVCPWNRKSQPHDEPEFKPLDALLEMNKKSWDNLSEEKFNVMFKESAVQRTGFEGLKRNISFVKKKD